MKRIGEVKAILNDRLLLLLSDEQLFPDDLVTVFSCVQAHEMQSAGIDQAIHYPKGDLKIVYPQGNKLYLAERYRQIEHKTRRVTLPSPFAKGILGLAAQLQPETKEIVEEVPGPWSAELDKAQMLNVKIPTIVSVGDPIGRRL